MIECLIQSYESELLQRSMQDDTFTDDDEDDDWIKRQI